MVWATVCSRSCFCWLYWASPSLDAKNIINLISVLIICWCPCVESSLVLLEENICYDQCVHWQNSISFCPASFYTPRPNLPVTPGVSWLPTFAFQSLIMKRTSFLGCSKRSWPGIKPMSLALQGGFFLGSLRKSLQWLLIFLTPDPPVYLLHYCLVVCQKITPILQNFYLTPTA